VASIAISARPCRESVAALHHDVAGDPHAGGSLRTGTRSDIDNLIFRLDAHSDARRRRRLNVGRVLELNNFPAISASAWPTRPPPTMTAGKLSLVDVISEGADAEAEATMRAAARVWRGAMEGGAKLGDGEDPIVNRSFFWSRLLLLRSWRVAAEAAVEAAAAANDIIGVESRRRCFVSAASGSAALQEVAGGWRCQQYVTFLIFLAVRHPKH